MEQINHVFGALAKLEANWVSAFMQNPSDHDNEWIISVIKYNEDNDDQETFYSETLEADIRAICNRLLVNHPLQMLSSVEFTFDYARKVIESRLFFKDK